MSRLNIGGTLLWAGRDLLRGPGDAVLTLACLAATAAALSTALLLTQAVSDTASRLLSGAPSLVVRRVDGGGWTPIPAAAVERIRSVPGVVSVRPRRWGVAGSGSGPVTVVGVSPAFGSTRPLPDSIRLPGPGEAVTGPGVETPQGRVVFGVGASRSRSFTVVGTLPEKTAMVSHDLVLLEWDDARRILDIPPGSASDLGVEVFHPQESEALAPELAAALPWPVRVISRAEAVKAYTSPVFRRGSLAVLALLPTVLTMVLLVLVTVRERVSRKEEIGLLRCLGWTTADLVRLHLFRAACVGIPGVLAGMAGGYALVFWPGVSWPSEVLLGWSRPAPGLFLDPAGALQVLAEIAALILLPFLAAAVGPVLRAGMADPRDLLEKGS